MAVNAPEAVVQTKKPPAMGTSSSSAQGANRLQRAQGWLLEQIDFSVDDSSDDGERKAPRLEVCVLSIVIPPALPACLPAFLSRSFRFLPNLWFRWFGGRDSTIEP